MKFGLPAFMADTMRATRSGNLVDATALLQTMLRGSAAAGGRAPIGLNGEPPENAGTGGEFVERSYRGPAGALGYRLYRPSTATAAMPLVVMLHGCTQDPEDFAVGTGMNRLAEAAGVFVAYPRQPQSANAQKCWNWFKPGDQQRDRGEPAMIAGMTRQLLVDEGIDARRVYVAGLSAGGAAAAIMAARYPDLYAAAAIHSGLACGAASDLSSALAAMRNGSGTLPDHTGRRAPVITFHGDRDTTVAEANSRAIIAEASTNGITVRTETGRSAGGRSFTRAIGTDADGRECFEQWTVHGAGHAWSGGDAAGSYTDPSGPDASREMLRFFAGHSMP